MSDTKTAIGRVKLTVRGTIGQSGDGVFEFPGIAKITLLNPKENGAKRIALSEESEIIVELA